MRLLMSCVLAVSLLMVSCHDDQDNTDFSLVGQGEPMPAFAINDTEGVVFDSQSAAGKKVFIYFFASYCPDCRKVTPSVIELWKQIKNEDVVFLCIARGGTNATREDAITYWGDVAANSGLTKEQMPALYHDAERQVYNKFATQNVPRYYVVGTNGNVAWQSEGSFTAETLRQHVESAK